MPVEITKIGDIGAFEVVLCGDTPCLKLWPKARKSLISVDKTKVVLDSVDVLKEFVAKFDAPRKPKAATGKAAKAEAAEAGVNSGALKVMAAMQTQIAQLSAQLNAGGRQQPVALPKAA